MPDPIPGATPENEMKLNNEGQLEQELEISQSDYFQKHDEESRVGYINKIEEAFAKFLDLSGEIKYENISNYLELWSNFIDFLNKHQIKSASYDLGYRFEIDAVLNNIEIDKDDKDLVKKYLLSLLPITSTKRRPEELNNERNRFVEQVQNPQRMMATIKAIQMESKAHSDITHGPNTMLRTTVSDENREKLPNIGRMTEAQKAILYGSFPQVSVSIWKTGLRSSLDATWNHGISEESYYTDLRRDLSQHFDLPFEYDDEAEEQEHIQALLERIRKEFGVNMKDIEEEIVAET